MKLIVGLGNIGKKYESTYHNIGFKVIDYISNVFKCDWIHKDKFASEFTRCSINEYDVILAKPSTYMNLSGIAVEALCNYYKIASNDIIVIQDDLDMKFASVKAKVSVGSGGHNGIKSISQKIGTEYIRLKIGIGRPESNIDISDYVLSKLTNQELVMIDNISCNIAQKIHLLLEHNISMFNANL